MSWRLRLPNPSKALILLKDDSKSKNKRIRTTFTEDQLQILQVNFDLDSNPDGQDLERIAQATGLSKRVTQVWFQNSRARQKKDKEKKTSSCDNESNDASSWTNDTAIHGPVTNRKRAKAPNKHATNPSYAINGKYLAARMSPACLPLIEFFLSRPRYEPHVQLRVAVGYQLPGLR